MGVKLSEWRLKITERVQPTLDRLRGGADKLSEKFTQVQDRINGGRERLREMASEIPGVGQALGLLSNPLALVAAGTVALGAGLVGLSRSSQELETKQRRVATLIGGSADQVDRFTASAQATSKVFGQDFDQVVVAANALRREFKGLSEDDSLQLVRQGLQATDGLLDLAEIREYSSQLSRAGLTAEQLVAISATGVREGIFSDKAPDTIKEAGLRLREMTSATNDALAGIGLSGSRILDELDSGSKTTFQVIQEVSAALASADTQARQTAIADVFGAAGEDAGERFVMSLASAKLELEEMVDLQNPMVAFQQRRLELEERILATQSRFSDDLTRGREQMELLRLQAMGVFFEAFAWLLDHGREILTILGSIAAVYLAVNGASLAMAAATKIATAAQWLLNAAMTANPLGIVIVLIGGLVAALAIAAQRSDQFRGFLFGLWEAFKQVFVGIGKLAKDVIGNLATLLNPANLFNPGKVKEAIGGIASAIGDYGKSIGQKYSEGVAKGVEFDTSQGFLGKVLGGANPLAGGARDRLAGPPAPAGAAMGGGAGGAADDPELKAGIAGVSGGGPEVRNVTVHFQSLIENYNSRVSPGGDPVDEERSLIELLIRVIRGSELALANE